MVELIAIGVGCRKSAPAKRSSRSCGAPSPTAASIPSPLWGRPREGGRAAYPTHAQPRSPLDQRDPSPSCFPHLSPQGGKGKAAALLSLIDKRGEPGLRAAADALGFDLTFCRARRCPPPRRACSPASGGANPVRPRLGGRSRGAGGGGTERAVAGAAPRGGRRDLRDRDGLRRAAERAAMTIHLWRRVRAPPTSSPCAGATCSRAVRSVSMRARWCRRHCSPIVHPARASRHRGDGPRPDRRAMRRRACPRPGRRAAAFGRSFRLERDGRANPPARGAGIPYTVTPGVPAFAAAAAALGRELTLPEVAHRCAHPHAGRASRCRRASARRLRGDRRDARDPSVDPCARPQRAELTPFYGADCPVAIVYRASWPDERILRGTLATSPRRRRRRRSGAAR